MAVRRPGAVKTFNMPAPCASFMVYSVHPPSIGRMAPRNAPVVKLDITVDCGSAVAGSRPAGSIFEFMPLCHVAQGCLHFFRDPWTLLIEKNILRLSIFRSLS